MEDAGEMSILMKNEANKKAQNDCNCLYTCTTNNDIIDTFIKYTLLIRTRRKYISDMVYLKELQMML